MSVHIKLKRGMSQTGSKLEIIRTIRNIMTVIERGESKCLIGLKDTVDLYEAMKNEQYVEFPLPMTSEQYDTFHMCGYFDLDGFPDSYINVRKICEIYRSEFTGVSGKINSIKSLRMCLGIGLKEAKDMVDHMDFTKTHVSYRATQEEIDALREHGFSVRAPYSLSLDEELFMI